MAYDIKIGIKKFFAHAIIAFLAIFIAGFHAQYPIYADTPLGAAAVSAMIGGIAWLTNYIKHNSKRR